MSELSVASRRFWGGFDTEVAGTLSDAQRREIDRVLDQTSQPGQSEPSDLRLSFKWFFVRLAWGWEKRSPERIKQEREAYPAMAPRNAPMLASLVTGYVVVFYGMLALSAVGVAYLMS